MAVAGIYRRRLPSPPAVDFSSPDGKRIFTEALQSGTMEGFFKLISYFQTQSEPAYCGLASLAMVLNSLAIDPGRKWKGPWRWFDETMLDCCEPLEKIKDKGITFGKVVCLAQCAGVKVKSLRTSQSTIDEFRDYVKKCASSEDCHMIASYHRKPFMQTGSGHFSPIGGYHAGSDMALILDVARFKYPPHWVPLTLIWEAMDTIDEATGYPRGFMLISRPYTAPSLLYTLNCRHESWFGIAKYLMDDVPLLLKSETMNSVSDVLNLVFQSLAANAADFVKWIADVRRQEEDGPSLSTEEKERHAFKEEVLRHVSETVLFKIVTEWLSSANSACHNVPCLSGKDSLAYIAASVCCQGAELFSGGLRASPGYCCRETCIKCSRNNGDSLVTIVSGTVVSGGSKQGVDMLVPVSPTNSRSFCGSVTSNCLVMHPASNDVLTVLMLALPPDTWAGIKNESLLAEIRHLVYTDSLPSILQEEVLHLRRQLHLLSRCRDGEAE